jgi:hypothetical protein
MGLFCSAPEPINPIEEVDKKAKGLICLACGLSPEILNNCGGLYYCDECLEAKQRREKWESEEHLWSKSNEEKG